mgnify:CR=1 FL=1
MRSVAAIKSHPIHPILIVFPFAYLAGGFVASAAGALFKRRDLSNLAGYLTPAGIATGLAAAVPGLIDYTYSVPPDSSAKQRATTHALVNSSALALFTAAWLTGRRQGRSLVPLAFQTLGMAAISVGGWLGGTLVYRNQIGVDHRYANAGKWDDQRTDEAGRIELETGELTLDQMKLLRMNGQRIAVGRTEKGYAAFQDRCTHKGGPLSDGVLICGTVQCPWHGSQFDVHTGRVKCGPAENPIETFEVKRSPGQLRLVDGNAKLKMQSSK